MPGWPCSAPEVDLEALPVRKGASYALDKLTHRILTVLRRSRDPMPTPNVVGVVARDMGYPPEACPAIQDRVGHALREMARSRTP